MVKYIKVLHFLLMYSITRKPFQLFLRPTIKTWGFTLRSDFQLSFIRRSAEVWAESYYPQFIFIYRLTSGWFKEDVLTISLKLFLVDTKNKVLNHIFFCFPACKWHTNHSCCHWNDMSNVYAEQSISVKYHAKVCNKLACSSGFKNFFGF